MHLLDIGRNEAAVLTYYFNKLKEETEWITMFLFQLHKRKEKACMQIDNVGHNALRKNLK
jgi:hypothetical protein